MKGTVREEMLKKRENLKDRKRREVVIGEKIRSLAEFKRANTVCAYYPIKGEVDVLKSIEGLGKRVCLPKVKGETLLFGDTQSGLVKGSFGIMEPSVCNVPFEEIELFLVPGVAFDMECFRLGYGKGFYDRLIKNRYPHQLFVGVCFALQLIERLPRDTWDSPVDMVITEKHLIRRSPRIELP